MFGWCLLWSSSLSGCGGGGGGGGGNGSTSKGGGGSSLTENTLGLIQERTQANGDVFFVYRDADDGLNKGFPSASSARSPRCTSTRRACFDPGGVDGCSRDEGRCSTSHVAPLLRVSLDPLAPGELAGLSSGRRPEEWSVGRQRAVPATTFQRVRVEFERWHRLGEREGAGRRRRWRRRLEQVEGGGALPAPGDGSRLAGACSGIERLAPVPSRRTSPTCTCSSRSSRTERECSGRGDGFPRRRRSSSPTSEPATLRGGRGELPGRRRGPRLRQAQRGTFFSSENQVLGE